MVSRMEAVTRMNRHMKASCTSPSSTAFSEVAPVSLMICSRTAFLYSKSRGEFPAITRQKPGPTISFAYSSARMSSSSLLVATFAATMFALKPMKPKAISLSPIFWMPAARPSSVGHDRYRSRKFAGGLAGA